MHIRASEAMRRRWSVLAFPLFLVGLVLLVAAPTGGMKLVGAVVFLSMGLAPIFEKAMRDRKTKKPDERERVPADALRDAEVGGRGLWFPVGPLPPGRKEGPRRVVLMDSSVATGGAMRSYLETLARVEVVGQATSADEAPAMLRELQPDLLIVNATEFTDTSAGIEVMKVLRESSPDVPIMCATTYREADSEMVAALLRSGADELVKLPISASAHQLFLNALEKALSSARGRSRVGPMEDQPTEQRSNEFSANIAESTLVVLNPGDVTDINSISVNVSTLARTPHTDVAMAVKEITEAVAGSTEIGSAQRTELIELLDELSKQALLFGSERAKPGVVKGILAALATGLGAPGGLAEVWSTWGPHIQKFFGL